MNTKTISIHLNISIGTQLKQVWLSWATPGFTLLLPEQSVHNFGVNPSFFEFNIFPPAASHSVILKPSSVPFLVTSEYTIILIKLGTATYYTNNKNQHLRLERNQKVFNKQVEIFVQPD